MAKTTSDSILGVIRKFELVLTRRAVLADKGYHCQHAIYGNAKQHGVGGGLRSLDCFSSFICGLLKAICMTSPAIPPS